MSHDATMEDFKVRWRATFKTEPRMLKPYA